MYVTKCLEIVRNCVALFYMHNGLTDRQSALAEGSATPVYCKAMSWSTLFLRGIKSTLKSKDPVKELVTNIH